MMNNNKQTAVYNPTSTAADYASGTLGMKKGITALYSRLSREDSLDGQSLSIQNQQQILGDYAKNQGFTNTVHFADDGTTGVRFDREKWQKLIAEVEAGNVSILCVKDMSRLGRDHVQVGMYMELFRQKGVRFIAIGNNIDSIYPETLEFAPFINIMSEWYARDTSRKIKAVAHSKGNTGTPLSFKCIYGYRKSPDDKHKWLIDEEAAAVVRRIFQMAMDGMGPQQIARQLTKEKIEKPLSYLATRRKNSDKPSNHDLSNPYTWRDTTIREILKKPEYCGHTVNFRTYKDSYKDKQSKKNTPDKWKIFENAHEPIISQEVFDTVQRLRKTPRRVDKIGEANPLTGLVYCADCHAKLYNSRQSKEYYEDNANGKLSDERYTLLSANYEKEQADLRNQNTELSCQLTAYETDSFKADRFIEIVKRYTEFDTLTNAMLNEFVEKIYVHEADKSSGQREQQVDIHLNFIGHFELPHEELPPPTAEELEEEEKRRRRLEYQREANKRWYAKKKQETQWQRAFEAGEISAEELEARKQEQQAKEEAEAAHREKRTQEKRDYAREWAKNKRARLKAEREAVRLLEPPDSELSPDELKRRKYERKKERDRENLQAKRERDRAEKAKSAQAVSTTKIKEAI